MTDQEERIPTEQETAIYEALNTGDSEAIEEMRVNAYADLTIEQFNIDYTNAHAHYQADHEIPEEEREQATAELVEVENSAAQEEGAEEE